MLQSLIKKDRELGRYIYRPEGTVVNSFNQAEMKVIRALGSAKLDQDIVQKIEELYYRPNFSFDEGLINDLKNSLEPDLMSSAHVTKPVNKQSNYYFIDSQDLNFSQEVDSFNQIITSSKLKKNLRRYFGTEFKFEHAATGWADPISNRDENFVPTAWHLDAYFRTSKTRCFIFLSDENTRNAPLQIINRGDTQKILSEHSIDYIHKNPDIVEEKAEIHEFNGSTGDFIIFNPATHLHRATYPTEGDYRRKTLMVDFVPKLNIL